MTLEQVKNIVQEHEIEFFLCSFVEMSGAPKAKVIPVTHLDDMAIDGAGFGGLLQVRLDKVHMIQKWQVSPTLTRLR